MDEGYLNNLYKKESWIPPYSRKRILVYCDTGWAIGRIYKDLHKYLYKELELKYYCWSKYSADDIISILPNYDKCITNLIYFTRFKHLSPEILNKFIFSCHGFQEIQDLGYLDITLPIGPTYSILSKSVKELLPDHIQSNLYHTYNGVELNNFDYVKRNGELKNLGWCGGRYIYYKRSDWCNEICEKTGLNFLIESNLNYDELRKWYSTIDILLINSGPDYFNETGPLPAFEAIASGVLVIGTSVGNFAEVPGPKYSTIEEAISIIEDLKKNPDKVIQIAEAQYECVKYKWSYEYLAHQWRDMYFNVPNFLKITSIDFDYSEDSKLLQEVNNIPRIIHIIWVGEKEQPSFILENVKKWEQLMPNWQIRLWTNNDITTKNFPLDIIYLLDKVVKGVQKADIMRYYIIEKYGGFYMDGDITPHRSLEPFINQLPDTDIILCHDIAISWQYIMNAFFAAIPHHPIIKTACELCKKIIINTEDIHLQTGPRLLGESVFLNQMPKISLIKSSYFYHNDNIDWRFGTHCYLKQW